MIRTNSVPVSVRIRHHSSLYKTEIMQLHSNYLKDFIRTKANSRNNVIGSKHRLFDFRKVICWIFIQFKYTKFFKWVVFMRPHFSWIENSRDLVGICLWNDLIVIRIWSDKVMSNYLNVASPLREFLPFNCIIEISSS
jgi:hypothetical protein